MKISPGDLEIRKAAVHIALAKGDMAGAGELLDWFGQGLLTDAGVLILFGDLYMLQGSLEKARTSYEQAVAVKPGRIRARLKLAICLLEQGERFEAERLVTRCRGEGIKQSNDLMLLADFYLLAGRDAGVEHSILRAIDGDPGNVGFRRRLYLFYREAAMVEKAETYLNELISVYPGDAGFRMLLADLYLSKLDMDAAEQVLTELEKMRYDAVGYHLLMGKYWLFKGRYSHGVSYLKTALGKNAGLASAHYLLGVAYFAGGQTKLAKNAFVRALMLEPGHGDTLMAMAALNYKNQEYDLADRYIDRLLDIEEANWEAWQVKGLCALEQGASMPASRFFPRHGFWGGMSRLCLCWGRHLKGEG